MTDLGIYLSLCVCILTLVTGVWGIYIANFSEARTSYQTRYSHRLQDGRQILLRDTLFFLSKRKKKYVFPHSPQTRHLQQMHFGPTSHFSAICFPHFYIHCFSQQLLLQAKGRGTLEIPISEVSALDTSGCLQYWKKPSWRSTNLGDNFFWIICLIACPHLSLDFSF